MSFPTYVDLKYGDDKITSSTKLFPIGMKGVMPDGRVFRYCLADGTLLKGWGSKNNDGLHEQNATVEAAAGAYSIQLVIGTATKDQFAGGWLNTHGDISIQHNVIAVKGNEVGDGTDTVIYLEEPLLYTVPAATFTDLHENTYNSIIKSDLAMMSVVVIPPEPVDSGDYFWGQTRGPCTGVAGFTSGIGEGSSERNVFFGTDGAIGTSYADLSLDAAGYQFAGYMHNRTQDAITSVAGNDIFFYLCLE